MINPLPAAPVDEYDTEPSMPAVSGLLCWYCDKPALPDTHCYICEVALCREHKHTRLIKEKTVVVCERHCGECAN